MSIQLTPEQEHFVNKQLQEGSYDSADQVVNEAFRTLAERNRQLSEIREHIREGLAQADRGEFSGRSIPEIIDDCKRQRNLL